MSEFDLQSDPRGRECFTFVYTGQGAAAVAEMPGGPSWLDVIEKIPERERHLFIHQGHMVEMNDADMAAWRAGGHVSVPSITLTGPAETIGEAVAALARDGATEVMIQPSGPDIPRELETFIAAAPGDSPVCRPTVLPSQGRMLFRLTSARQSSRLG